MYILFIKVLLASFFFNSSILGFSQSLLSIGILTQIQPYLSWFVVFEVSTQTVLSPFHVFCALFLFTGAATGYAYNSSMGVFFLGLFWARTYIGQAWSWDYVELISLILVFLTGAATHGAKVTKTILALFCLCHMRLFDISSFHIARSDYLLIAGQGSKYAAAESHICFIFFRTASLFIAFRFFRAKAGFAVSVFLEHCALLALAGFFMFRLFYKMGRFFVLFEQIWHPLPLLFGNDITTAWLALRPGKAFVSYILRYAFIIFVPTFRFSSVFGFALLVNMVTQMLSGFLLALYFVPDPSFVMTFREEYMNEIWWFAYVHKAHVVGVDSIFVLSYLHIFKKIYIKNFLGADLDGWVTGTYAFLVYHVVVFLGITLSSNHLGDLTLTIAANIFWSIFLFKHKAYVAFFTNRHLNVDQLTRFMIGHYVIAWYYMYLVQTHVMYIHEMWDADSGTSAPQDGSSPKGNWVFDALQREAAMMVALYVFFMSYFTYQGHPSARPVEFGFFEQWAEAEMEDLNFFIVGPHWYFRPHMGLLTICATHYEGLFWLGAYYVILALMPLWGRMAQPTSQWDKLIPSTIPLRDSLIQKTAFIGFVGSIFYVGGTLPCARFYYEGDEGFFGNSFLRVSYQYVYLYLLIVIHWLDRGERFVLSQINSFGSFTKLFKDASALAKAKKKLSIRANKRRDSLL